MTCPAKTQRRTRFGHPILIGLPTGALVSGALATELLAPLAPSHALLLGVVATPYLAFAVVDTRLRSVVAESAVATMFVVAALALLDGPAWPIAVALMLHAGWDLFHTHRDITTGVAWWAPWCASFDLSAAALLLAAECFA